MALFLVASAVLSLSQMSIVYTLQKSLMAVDIVKYSSNDEDRFLRQTDPFQIILISILWNTN